MNKKKRQPEPHDNLLAELDHTKGIIDRIQKLPRCKTYLGASGMIRSAEDASGEWLNAEDVAAIIKDRFYER